MNVIAFTSTPTEKTWTLADQAKAINAQFKRLDRAQGRIAKAKDAICTSEFTVNRARVNAGQALIEAKAMLTAHAPGASFEAWCGDNVKRNLSDCYKCMSLAGHDDPELALSEERAERAEGMSARRASQLRSAVPQLIVEQLCRAVKMIVGMYRNLPADQRLHVMRALEEINHASQ